MGSHYSKLKKALEKGDEHKVLEIYKKNTDIRKRLNANAIINDYTLDTYMHYAAKMGMLEFLKLLLNENNGNPNKQNKRKQTVLHKACEGTKDQVQFECMKLLFQWRDNSTKTTNKNIIGSSEHNIDKLCDIDVNAKDDLENTPMHYAAMKNLPTCVQSLVSHGAYLFVENHDRSTPCDLAERFGHRDIALYLESKMIFSKDDEKEIDDENEVAIVEEKQNFGLRLQDLQAEKDKLLVETAEMLHSSIYTAEILLKKHSWSKNTLLNFWMEDPVKVCEKCGISGSLVEAIKIKKSLKNPQDTNSLITFDSTVDLISNKSEQNFKNESIKNYQKTSDSNSNNQNFNDTVSNGSAKVTQAFELNLSNVIARKLSGRFMKLKKKDDSLSSFESSNPTLIQNEKKPLEKTFNDSTYFDKNLSKFSENQQLEDISKENIDLTRCGICFMSFDKPTLRSKNTSLDIKEENINEEDIVRILCGHEFCKNCCEQYFTMKIEEGNVIDIVCPQTDCFAIIPPETVESLVSKETAKKYLQFDIKAFVDSNPTIKWCPSPGCGMAVRNPRLVAKSTTSEILAIDYSQSVDCGLGHYFCWDCLQEGHEPATCQNWKDWYQKILEIKPEELHNTNENQADSANYLWLVTNSKKCPNPNCNAPIQKNEGCNHVKCYRCKLDFCWICLESWKKHSSATGGYFQCNRYEVSQKIIQKEKAMIAEAENKHYKAVEINKFVHYYTRFKNHENSYRIEEPLLATARTKLEILTARQSVKKSTSPTRSEKVRDLNEIKRLGSEKRKSLTDCTVLNNTKETPNQKPLVKRISIRVSKLINNTQEYNTIYNSSNDANNSEPGLNDQLKENINLNENSDEIRTQPESEPRPTSNNNNSDGEHLFIEDAIKELLKARRILRCSYVYGYYLDTFGHQKFIFEFIQTEFEECTENLSQIIARPHLKTPKHKIIRLTNILKRKRIEFIDTITRGLNSFNETPPALKKYSRQRWKYLLKDNIQNDDEFKNTIALSLKELNPKNPWIIDKKGRHTNFLALLDDWPELESELDSILIPSKDKKGLCANWNCGNVRAVNTLSGSLCNYCSIRCMRNDHKNYLEQKKNLNKPSQNSSDKTETFKTRADFDSKKSPECASSACSKMTSGYFKSKNNFLGINEESEKTSSLYLSDKSLKSADSIDISSSGEKISNTNDNTDLTSSVQLQKTIELSKLQHLIDLKNQNKDNNFNLNALEFDVKKAIELSLVQESPKEKISNLQLTHFGDNRNVDELALSKPTTSKMANESKSLNNSHKVVKIPYDSLFLGADEKEISVYLKNMKNVLYDPKNEEDKCFKVINYPVKSKK